MKKIVIVILILSCDHTEESSEGHLRALGYKAVTCAGAGLATCTADDAHFHCAVTNATGCRGDQRVACERFYSEKPTP